MARSWACPCVRRLVCLYNQLSLSLQYHACPSSQEHFKERDLEHAWPPDQVQAEATDVCQTAVKTETADDWTSLLIVSRARFPTDCITRLLLAKRRYLVVSSHASSATARVSRTQ